MCERGMVFTIQYTTSFSLKFIVDFVVSLTYPNASNSEQIFLHDSQP